MTTEAPNLRIRLLKALLPVAVILALVVGALTLVKSRVGDRSEAVGAGKSVELKEGNTLPDFTLHRYPKGEAVAASSLGAKVVLVNFWATWCEACMVEMPSIIKLRKELAPQGFEVVAINMDEAPESVLPRAIKEFDFGFPVYVDSEAKLAEIFDVRAIPLTVVMDRERRILFVESGGRDWGTPEMQARVKAWLAGKSG
jgi:thiol-disulfide isomerase/thioredoxin